jgi:tripartite-type tricarboxylate transporter receptor subunit TctC
MAMRGTFVRRSCAGWLACCAAICAAAPTAHAQSVADFYKGKSVTVVVGIAPGGGYDLSARTVARHIGRHIPGNPNVIVQNMPGVNSVLAANYVYGIAPRDGTVIWTGSRTAPYEPLMGNQAAKFQPGKVHWLGSTSSEIGVILAWHTAPHRTVGNLFNQTMIVGATDPGAENSIFPVAFNNLLGTKFQIVRGYANQGAIVLAMERGEVQGDANTAWSNLPTTHGDWLRDKKIRLLMQSSVDRHPDLPDLPSVLEFAKTDEQRQILKILLSMKTFGYPFFVGPEVPGDRVKALQAAFAATMKDNAFLADITQLLRKITPAPGSEMDEFISAAYAHPPAMIEKMRKALIAGN